MRVLVWNLTAIEVAGNRGSFFFLEIHFQCIFTYKTY
jgi:hypothetical protein